MSVNKLLEHIEQNIKEKITLVEYQYHEQLHFARKNHLGYMNLGENTISTMRLFW